MLKKAKLCFNFVGNREEGIGCNNMSLATSTNLNILAQTDLRHQQHLR